MYLNPGTAPSVIDRFGFKRVGWSGQYPATKKDDGRFSPRNKEWAAGTFIPPSDRNYDYRKSRLLDGFVNLFRKAQAELDVRLFPLRHHDRAGTDRQVLVMIPTP